MMLDLSSEVVLPPDLKPPQLGGSSLECALLTGATGYLGAYLLAELLRRTTASVVCLVRASSPAQGQERIRTNLDTYGLEVNWQRVRVLPGALEEPWLGLAPELYQQLSDEVDTIYHAAANVSFLPTYEKLKGVNVDGLLAMLRLAACGRAKSIHHVSTYSVFNAADYNGHPTVYEEPLRGSGQGFRRGYPASKWVAERIGDLARQRGFTIASYRAGLLSGDTRLGRSKDDDVMALNLEACETMGVAQDLDFLMHLTPVDYAAAALVEVSKNSPTGHYHLITETPISFAQVVDALGLPRLPAKEWYERCKAQVRSYPQWMPLLWMLSQDPQRSFWSDANLFSMNFDASRVRQAVQGSGLSCPLVDEALLSLYRASRRT